ncbi:MAG: hypothetical protein J6I98_01670, partial [Clostridia bacterium]|nr:hypothetical protein [Clostridia bacterium]
YCLLNRNAADVGGYTTVFTNSKPIVYYQKVNGVYLPAHEIAAGTQLIWSDSSILGYGSMTFPTYQAEWRWSRPFRNVNEKTNEADADWYYIKTKDLQDIALAVLNSSDSLKDSARGMKMSIAQYANAVIHTMDNLLYQNGVYISPNLYQPIWTPLCTVLLLVFLLNVSVWFFARYRLS